MSTKPNNIISNSINTAVKAKHAVAILCIGKDIPSKKALLPVWMRRNKVMAHFCAILWQKHIPLSWKTVIDESAVENKSYIKRDTVYEYIYGDFEPAEYLRFHFETKNYRERSYYMSRMREVALYRNSAYNILPDDKYSRYLLLKHLYKREIIYIEFNDSEEEQKIFARFTENRKSFIVKPVRGYMGIGVMKIERESVPTLEHLKKLTQSSKCILEELILAGDEVSCFHPNSVNTVRMVTSMNKDGEFAILYAMLRIGIGDSVVDNIGSGGIGVMIDVVTGKLKGKGLKTENGIQYFDKHPDSEIGFDGYQLPKWQTVCDLAEQTHKTMKSQLLLGWDFAWNQNEEWDLVEVNPSPGSRTYQMIQGGIIPLLEKNQIPIK